MRMRVVVCLSLAFLTACNGTQDPESVPDAPGPRDTIAALSQAIRDGDYRDFVSLHTEECFAEEVGSWERMQEESLSDPAKVKLMAERLGMTEADVRRMDWKDGLAEMLRFQVKADPDWTAHLEDLTVIGERTDGDSSRLTVRYGEPKPREEHELLLIRRDGRWLVHEWD